MRHPFSLIQLCLGHPQLIFGLLLVTTEWAEYVDAA